MTPIDQLIAADQSSPKRLAVIGDGMEDLWHLGTMTGCQDACPCFKETSCLSTPGGAAGAARQLYRWNSKAFLISPLRWQLHNGNHNQHDANRNQQWDQVDDSLCLGCSEMPIKHRYLAADKIVFRRDELDQPWKDIDTAKLRNRTRPWDNVDIDEWRHLALKAIREMKFDGVLISDYDKGFMDVAMIQDVVRYCNKAGIPVVADAKRHPDFYIDYRREAKPIIKANHLWQDKFSSAPQSCPIVITNGDGGPLVKSKRDFAIPSGVPVPCLNHVGAGDCFAAHLLLSLVNGLAIEEAAAVAHSAGRVYVQHRFGRPPWPHEIRQDLDPLGGKVVRTDSSQTLLRALRQSTPERIVFANGVFRLPHLGHAQLLTWAKKQGDVLVVGINSDCSAHRLRLDQFIYPLADRMATLAAIEAVDWIVPFTEDTPEALMEILKPDILIKGSEYEGKTIPGANLVKEVRFYPMEGDVFHSSDLLEEMK